MTKIEIGYFSSNITFITGHLFVFFVIIKCLGKGKMLAGKPLNHCQIEKCAP